MEMEQVGFSRSVLDVQILLWLAKPFALEILVPEASILILLGKVAAC
jgi:hypothetical protein